MDRVVLGQKAPHTKVGFQWTGAEPEGLDDTEFAEALGAQWEDDELVTYDLPQLQHFFEHYGEDWQADPD